MRAAKLAGILVAAGLILAGRALAGPVDPRLVVPHLKGPLVAAGLAPTEKRIRIAGNLKVTQVAGTIDIGSAGGRAVIAHTVLNRSGQPLGVRAGMAAVAPRSVKLAPGPGSTLRFESPVPVRREGVHLRSAVVAPQLVVDDSFLLEPVDEVAIEVVLPPDARKIIKSNRPLMPVEGSDGRPAYRWQASGEYLTAVAIWWTTSETDLSIEKTIRPDWENGAVAVTLKIRNNGTAPAADVLLKEDFPTQIFAAGSASGGKFTRYEGEVNDTRLVWEQALPRLEAGEQISAGYTLRIDPRLTVAGLHETRALQDGEVVAMSDTVRVRRQRR